MDWGIVASITVALALFILASMTICIPIFMLMARGMKKKMQTVGQHGCPMPCGSNSGNIEPAKSQCTSKAQ